MCQQLWLHLLWAMPPVALADSTAHIKGTKLVCSQLTG
jgi:hypothetical protein